MDRFPGAGGVEIAWQHWMPAGDPVGVVGIAHGVSEHSDRYAHVAERLNKAGYAVAALDHRGHGDSEGKRAVIDRMANAVADVGTTISLARELAPGTKLTLLGHSMGGCIGLEYALRHPETIDGLILSAPATDLEAANAFERIAARVASAVAPSLGVFQVDATTVSRDPEVVRLYVEDPRVFHGKLPARTVAEMAGVIDTFRERVPTLELPLLVILGTGDRLVPPAAGRMVHELASSPDKQIIEYEGLYHEVLNEPEQEKVMDDVVGWLDARMI